MSKKSKIIDTTEDDYTGDEKDENQVENVETTNNEQVNTENEVKETNSVDEEDDPFGGPSSPEKDDDSEEYEVSDGEINKPRKRSRRGIGKTRSKKIKLESDDEEFKAEDADSGEEDDELILSDDDEYVERRKKRENFIVDDENDWDDNEDDYDTKPKKKRGRKRKDRSVSVEPRRTTRSGRSLNEEDDSTLIGNETREEEGDIDDIQKEIADLYDSSPMHESEPSQHKLRQRTKVDYTIPPPINNDLFTERPTTPTNVRGRRGRPTAKPNEFRKILYPTAGPFGGSDVISLFGTNIPPGGIPLPGLTNTNNLTAIGQNVSDSDTSEDEIAPMNGEATVSKKQPKIRKGSEGQLITGGSDDKKKNKNNLSDTDPLGVDMNIDFSVVGGLDNYINQLKEMVALPLLYPELYQNFAITPPRGVLFHGPPGTGKTLMARALAASCSTAERKITFFMRKGADCLSKWVGEAERQLRLLFEEAKNQQPSIIFFDEIDGLAPVRSSKQEQIHASIVSTLLALMDGMDNRGQVIVIGATNRPDAIDPALRRPGRFDREFYFPLPDINARKEILQIHTKKWTPPLTDSFVENLAELTKGYGGADLRALCTEAALNSIQRKYPQIYETNHKLAVKPEKVKVIAKDFMRALDKIVPSSARSTSSGSSPLPEHLKPLLQSSYDNIILKLNDLIPNSVQVPGRQKLTALEEAKYLDPTVNDPDGGFAKQQLLKSLESSRVCRPQLLVSGHEGNGQQYLSAAVLNYLEGFQVQSLDLGTMFGDSTRTAESTIIQTFIEARRHQPAIILIPTIDVWFQILPESAQATLSSLLRGLKSNEKILLLGFAETTLEDLDDKIKLLFGFESSQNNVLLQNPNKSERSKYFQTLWKTIQMKPYEFINDIQNRPKRKLKELRIVEPEFNPNSTEMTKKKLKEQEYQDTKLKNVLKIKLAGLMDLFKVRYKRFKKPIVDESFLYHLFDPEILQNPFSNYQVQYIRSDDQGKENMIKELATGKNYYNMDLDTIEERLWNGFYSEPRQFLKDLKLILKDSITSGDRDRILKSNEMITNAQFGIDDFSTPEFLKACQEVRERDLKKQEKLLKEHEELKKQLENQPPTVIDLVQEQEVIANGSKTGDNVVTEQIITQNGTLEAPISLRPFDKTDSMNLLGNGKPQNVENSVPVEPAQNLIQKPTSIQVQKQVEEEEEESESEAEELVDIDTTKEIKINKSHLTDLEHKLVKATKNYSVDKLEMIMSRLMDIVWKDRNEWDKSSTVQNIEKLLSSLT
ncbi:YTA7 [Candida pseudojiufengensis]|uniref:YTA7 n=1 Tax=Candida pseudojiufengensis TaxID=497109 RepID=UPI002224D171|nr:YTA7 [Candida pseudojiufengensis]KAI5964329.1 YTA7 [Candida pseudojiufengensis]